MILLTSGSVLLLTCTAFVAYELLTFRRTMIQSVTSIGKIVAANSTAALAFDNQADAVEVLAGLKAEPELVAAAIYGQDGKLFARYPASRPIAEFPAAAGPEGYRFESSRLIGFQAIEQSRELRLGSLYLESDTTGMSRRFRLYGVIVLAVMLVSIAAAYAIARGLQHQISAPILALAETARAVSDRHDYSVRAHKREGGELGLLTDAFNHMLTQIQEQNSSLEESEKRHRLLFENSPLPMWVYDLDSLRFLAVNGAAILSYGYSRDEFLAMTIKDIRPVEDLPALFEDMAETPRTSIFHSPRIWKHRKKDGTVILVEITSHDLKIDDGLGRLVVANDVTARFRAEAELRESEARMRAVLNSALSGVVLIDATGAVLDWNPRAEAMFGWPRDEACGRELAAMIIPPEFRELHRRGLQRFLATGEGPVLDRLLEMSALRRDGSAFPIELSISPLKSGEIVTFCGFVTDITERKKAEAEIRQLNEQLEQRIQQRTAQLEEANKELEAFSYSVSHDLRAPLRHVHGYVAMLQRSTEGQLSDKARRHLKIIGDASVEMGQLIDDLLDFSRMGRTEMRQSGVSLDNLVQTALQALEMATRSRNIVWKIAPLPAVVGDAAMLRQVFANLAGNAVKYTRQRDPAEIEIGCAGEEDGRVIVFVRDNGAGFDMQYAHKLFGVFQRLHRADEFEGTGIGLATVRRVVSRHGGRVWAEGAVDKGATFYFTLQRARDGASKTGTVSS